MSDFGHPLADVAGRIRASVQKGVFAVAEMGTALARRRISATIRASRGALRGRLIPLACQALAVTVLATLTAGVAAAPATAAPPDNFQTSLIVGDGLDGPSGFEIAPDGRIFILERAGKVKIVKNGQLLAQPFVDSLRQLGPWSFESRSDPEFGTSNHFVTSTTPGMTCSTISSA
jgi:hypothetical protein